MRRVMLMKALTLFSRRRGYIVVPIEEVLHLMIDFGMLILVFIGLVISMITIKNITIPALTRMVI
ncbi:putative holin-like toxin [Staphylococcus pettenkoferi]|uniref:putative holin-like toxin n=2 Tax=Staphylococcus pettenkoferi TaxID=170573 RepID=UPI0035E28F46